MSPPPPALDDEHPPAALADLLVRAARGDVAAFARLYDDTAPRVHGLVLRVVRDPALAEEVTRGFFLQAWHNAGSFDPARCSALAWLMASAHRRAVDSVRAGDMADGDAIGPRGSAVTTADTLRVRGALDRLVPEQREALELAFFGGYTHTEVDLLVDASGTGSPSLIRDGLLRLRHLLQPAA